MSGSKTFAELPADKEIYWDSSESNLYADLVEGDFLIIRKGKLSLECGVNTASYGATNDDASDIYPKITFFPCPGRPNGFLLVVSERELNLKEGDVARIWAIRDRIKKQVDSDISHIRPLEGGIPFVCYVEGITNTLMNASVKDTFIDAREHGYFSNFENHLLSVMSSDIEREYLKDIFNVIHRNNRNY